MSDLRLIFLLLISAMLTGCAAVVVGTGIATGAAVAHDRRTAGTVVEDKEILFKALNLLNNENPDIREKSNITVTPYNLQVLLTGQAISDEVSQRYAQLVAQIPRVRKVFNEVVVGAESTWTEEADDVYMNSKVKLALFNLGIKGFDPTRVEVTSSQGVVYLMGLLTPQEADVVAEKVRFVGGVKRVVTLFEYIQPAT